MSRSDDELVRDALDHINILKRHLQREGLADETVADAVSLRLAAAIDAVSEASTEFRNRTFGDDSRIIWAPHNRIAHGYAFLDLALVRRTAEDDLPGFEQKLRDSIN